MDVEEDIPTAEEITAKDPNKKIILPGKVWLGDGQQPSFPDRVYPGIILNKLLNSNWSIKRTNEENLDDNSQNDEDKTDIRESIERTHSLFYKRTKDLLAQTWYSQDTIVCETLNYDPFCNDEDELVEVKHSDTKTIQPIRFIFDSNMSQFNRLHLKLITTDFKVTPKYITFKMFACKRVKSAEETNINETNINETKEDNMNENKEHIVMDENNINETDIKKWNLIPQIKVLQVELSGYHEELKSMFNRTRYYDNHAMSGISRFGPLQGVIDSINIDRELLNSNLIPPRQIPAMTEVNLYIPIDLIGNSFEGSSEYYFGLTNDELREIYDCFLIELIPNPDMHIIKCDAYVQIIWSGHVDPENK